MSETNQSQQPPTQPGRSQRVAGKDSAPQTPAVNLDEALAPEDDWTNVDDPIERRKIQNRLAQRKLREKSRQQKEAIARDTQNRKLASSAYLAPDPEDAPFFDDEVTSATLSGAPWGTYPMGLTLRRVSSTHTHSSMGRSQASSQASTSGVGPSMQPQTQQPQQQFQIQAPQLQSQQLPLQPQPQQQYTASRESSRASAAEAGSSSARTRSEQQGPQDSSHVGHPSGVPTVLLPDARVAVRPVDDVQHLGGPGMGVGSIGRHSVGLGLSQQFAWSARIPQRRASALPWFPPFTPGGAPGAAAAVSYSYTAASPTAPSTATTLPAATAPGTTAASAAAPGVLAPTGLQHPGAVRWQPYPSPASIPRGMWQDHGARPWTDLDARQPQLQQQRQESRRRPSPIPVTTWYDGWGRLRGDESDNPTPRVRTFTAGSGAGPFGEMPG